MSTTAFSLSRPTLLAGRDLDTARRWGAWIAFLAASLVSGCVYVALQGALPYHDAPRFIGQVHAGRPVWDIAHLLLQPAALALTRVTGAAAEPVLKAMSCVATAVAVGLFAALLVRQGLGGWRCWLGTLLLGGCCSVLTLAPSAHPKLVAFPFVTAALLVLCETETRVRAGFGREALGGALLAVGGALLASVLATVPFAALVLLIQGVQRGEGWTRATARGLALAGAAGLVFAALVAAGFSLISGEALSLHGLLGSVSEKTNLRPLPSPVAVQLARAVFGTVNDIVTVQGLGATMQAWMRGQIPSLRPYADLWPGFLLWAATAATLATMYAATAVRALRTRRVPMALAFLCGAQAWSVWYRLNDPEHWFQLCAPSILLFLTGMPRWAVRWVFPPWVAAVVAANLLFLAIPAATYPLARHEAALARMLERSDMLVSFAAYPGRPYVGFFELPDVMREKVDVMVSAEGATADAVLAQVDGDIDRVLTRGGRVIVADMLRPRDWEAPWMLLLGRGITKPRLFDALLHGRTATRLADEGGIALWELRPGGGA